MMVVDPLAPVTPNSDMDRLNASDQIMVIFLTIMFSIGMGGNIWAIICVLWIWCKRKLPKRGVFRHMSAYIFLLSVSDVFVLTMMALATVYLLQHNWSFGTIACKVYWGAENVSKLLSNAILASISFERFLGVCKPFTICCIRDQIVKVFLVVLSQLLIIGCLSVPVIYYADVVEIEILSENGQNLTHLETIKMCRSDIPDDMLPSYVFMMVLLGCIVPTTITWCSYVCLVICLGRKSGTSPLIQAYRSRVAVFLFCAVTIHFVCWAPNWYSMTAIVSDFLIIPSPDLMHIIILLPYVNCSVNWILHALMNRELRNAFYSLLCPRTSVNSRETYSNYQLTMLQASSERKHEESISLRVPRYV